MSKQKIVKKTNSGFYNKGNRMLFPQNITSEETKTVITLMREFAKYLRNIYRIDESTAGRLAYYSLVNIVSERVDHILPYKDETFERFKSVKFGGEETIVKNIEKNPDLLDILYETLVEESYRKKKGQFLTPTRVAEFMSLWGMQDKAQSILDPAVGTGIFLDRASKLLRSSNWKLYGIDVEQVLLNATSLRLKLIGLPTDKDKIKLLHEDFLKSNLEQELIFDLVICNPPYLKFHNYDRQSGINVIEKKFGLKFSKLTNIYSLFFIRATPLVKNDGRMAFITPSEFFYTRYGEELKKFLIRNWTIEAFILFDFSKIIFNGALTTAVITLLRKNPSVNRHAVKFIRVIEWPEDYQVLMRAVTEGVRDDRYYSIFQIAQEDLNPSVNWLIYFGGGNYNGIIEKLVPLSELAQINRGIATGHNKFFTLNQNEVELYKIEDRFLKPVISKAAQCKGYEFTRDNYEKLKKKGEKVFLLYIFEEPSKNLWNYIKWGESMGVHQRYLTRNRRPWFSMEKGKVAPILATVFSRNRMRFILNKTNCLHLTAFHGIYPNFDDMTLIKALLAFLNSNLCSEIQAVMRREYGGGLHKFEPSDLEKLLVLNVTTLSAEDAKKLADLFDKLCSSARSSVKDEEKIKNQIDTELRKILCTPRFLHEYRKQYLESE
jgi:adenine-specific DNA-methyltransferase